MTDQPTCATCRFFGGVCKRYPPMMDRFIDANGVVHIEPMWPWTNRGDWCGEHEPVVDHAPAVGPWRDAETDPPPGELDVLTWSRGVGLQVGFRSSDLVPPKWISLDGDSYRPTMWMAILPRPDGGEA